MTLELSNLVFGYGSLKSDGKVYRPVSVTASRGQFIALIGRNGVGKSTLLRTIARIQPLLSGSISINGMDQHGIERKLLSRLISFIPAEPVHAPNMTVKEFVKLARFPYRSWFESNSQRDREAVLLAISSVNVQVLADRQLDTLSDGERQKVMIAFALAQDTDIILMDEPTAFLDLPNKFEIVRLLKQLAADGKTVLFSTHDINTTMTAVDCIWLMLPQGLVSGSPEDLALNGQFNTFLEGSSVSFNTSTGVFSTGSISNGAISICGVDPDQLFWTQHALERLGYSVTVKPFDQGEILCMRLGDTYSWRTIVDNEEWLADSIGELCKTLPYLKKV